MANPNIVNPAGITTGTERSSLANTNAYKDKYLK